MASKKKEKNFKGLLTEILLTDNWAAELKDNLKKKEINKKRIQGPAKSQEVRNK